MLLRVCQSLRQERTLTDEVRNLLSKTFQKRSEEALLLVEASKVAKFAFNPSGRTVWLVSGRKGEYQVLPESFFCTCDDYYFRVIGKKKQLCYHIIAQYLAQSLGKYRVDVLKDVNYESVASRRKPSATQART